MLSPIRVVMVVSAPTPWAYPEKAIIQLCGQTMSFPNSKKDQHADFSCKL